MARGFSNFKSFSGGFIGSLNEDAEISKKSQYAKDMMYQQEALKYKFAQENEALQEKKDQYVRNADMSQARDILGAMTTKATTPTGQGSVINADMQTQQPQDTSQTVQAAQAPVAPQASPAVDTTQQSSPQEAPQSAQPVNFQPQQAPQAQPQVQNTPPQASQPVQQQQNVNPAPDIASQVAYPQEHADDPQAALNEATMTAFAKNYKHGEPIPLQVMAARDEAKDVLLGRQKVQGELAAQKASLADKEPSIIYKDDNILKQQADKYGLPYNKDPVLAEMSRSELIKNRQADSKMLEKQAEPVVQNANESIDRLNNIVGLNKFVTTGGVAGIPGVADIKSSMEADSAELQKDMAYITLRNKPSSGYGRVTNADLNMFQKASPNFSIPNEANYVIAAGLMRQNMDQRDYWRFRQNWVQRYGGDDPATIDKLWDSYKDSNPIFDPKSTPAVPKFNADRQTPEEFFRGKAVDDILSSRGANSQLPTNVQPPADSSAQPQAPKADPLGLFNTPSSKPQSFLQQLNPISDANASEMGEEGHNDLMDNHMNQGVASIVRDYREAQQLKQQQEAAASQPKQRSSMELFSKDKGNNPDYIYPNSKKK